MRQLGFIRRGNALRLRARRPHRACAVCPQSGLRRRVPPSCRREPVFPATEAVKGNGAPAKPVLRGNRPLSTGGKWTERPPGGLYTKGEMPPGTPRSPVYRMHSSTPQPRVCRGAWLSPAGDGGRKAISQPTWLPLTRELSPQATEGENSQSASSEHPRFAVSPPYLSLRQALRACHLPRQREPSPAGNGPRRYARKGFIRDSQRFWHTGGDTGRGYGPSCG